MLTGEARTCSFTTKPQDFLEQSRRDLGYLEVARSSYFQGTCLDASHEEQLAILVEPRIGSMNFATCYHPATHELDCCAVKGLDTVYLIHGFEHVIEGEGAVEVKNTHDTR